MNTETMTISELRSIAALLHMADRLGAADSGQSSRSKRGVAGEHSCTCASGAPHCCECRCGADFERGLQLVRGQLTSDVARLEALLLADIRSRGRFRIAVLSGLLASFAAFAAAVIIQLH